MPPIVVTSYEEDEIPIAGAERRNFVQSMKQKAEALYKKPFVFPVRPVGENAEVEGSYSYNAHEKKFAGRWFPLLRICLHLLESLLNCIYKYQ